MSTANLEMLHKKLQQAIEIEFFTIPPYLCGLYSIHERQNPDARDIISGVVMEEMLHIALVSNVLKATGGTPKLFPNGQNSSLQKLWYPANIPHILNTPQIHLYPFSQKAIDQFVEIEKPDTDTNDHSVVDTIGEFYESIKNLLVTLVGVEGEDKVFSGDPERQTLPFTHYYGGGGRIEKVTSLHAAIQALNQVAEQGEGKINKTISGGNFGYGQEDEPAHYFRFKELQAGRRYQDMRNVSYPPSGEPLHVDWHKCYPMRDDPNGKDRTPNELESQFEDTYSKMLKNLELGLAGDSDSFRQSIINMHSLGHIISALMKVPWGEENQTLGPPFWYIKSK